MSDHKRLTQDLLAEIQKRAESENFLKDEVANLTSEVFVLRGDKDKAEARANFQEGIAILLANDNEYLKEQVKLYQTRLGLIAVPRPQGEAATTHQPIRKSRESFDSLSQRVAKAQADKKEEFWRERIKNLEVAGVTGGLSTEKSAEEGTK